MKTPKYAKVKQDADIQTKETVKTPKDAKRKAVQNIDDCDEMTDDVFEPVEKIDEGLDTSLEELNDLVRESLPGKKFFSPKKRKRSDNLGAMSKRNKLN